jgi:hypothetical protein
VLPAYAPGVGSLALECVTLTRYDQPRMPDLTKQQEQRARLLRALHEATKGSTLIGADYLELGAKLGLSQQETRAAMDYLTRVARWAQRSGVADPHACMTAEGVVEVERAIQAEQSPEPLRAWRRSCEAKTIAELQDGLDRGLYKEEKEPIARTVLEEKRERRREQGEVATLKQEISDLKGELRKKRTTLWLTRITVLIAALGLLASWRSELTDLFRSAVVAVKAPPKNALTLDVAPSRVDEFRPRPDNLMVFHQFSIRVQHPTPNTLDNLRAEITAMEPHRPFDAPLPLPLRIRHVGIHDAVVDVVRVNVNWLDTGPIQWCGRSLMLHPPDEMPPGGYPEAQTGLAPRERYVLTISVSAGSLSASRTFVLEPASPSYNFVASAPSRP